MHNIILFFLLILKLLVVYLIRYFLCEYAI